MSMAATPEDGTNVTQATPAEDAGPRPRKVSRTLLNFWLDVALFLVVTFVLWVSAMMQVVFPAPTAAEGWTLWGLSFNQWRNAQFFSLCLCALLALEHIVLHWNWVCSVIATQVLRVKKRPDEGNQALYGIATFIGIMVLALGSILVAMFTVQRPPDWP